MKSLVRCENEGLQSNNKSSNPSHEHSQLANRTVTETDIQYANTHTLPAIFFSKALTVASTCCGSTIPVMTRYRFSGQ